MGSRRVGTRCGKNPMDGTAVTGDPGRHEEGGRKPTMKLAEALSLRSAARRGWARLRAGAIAWARYQEGEEPAEDAAGLLAQARSVIEEIEGLVRRINRPTAATEVEPGLTIPDAIARRDGLALRRKLVTAVADAATGRQQEMGPHWAA